MRETHVGVEGGDERDQHAVAEQIKDSGKLNGKTQWLDVGMWVVFFFFIDNRS